MLQGLIKLKHGDGDGEGKEEEPIADDNLGVDYVLLFDYGKAEDKTQAIEQYKRLIRQLSSVGLETEVRPGHDNKLLIFVRARDEPLRKAVHYIRVRDWLHGVRPKQPQDDETAGRPEREAERLQAIFYMMVFAAEITPGSDEYPLLEMMFPLHHKEMNLRWIKSWSSKTFLTEQDLDDIRDVHGEHVAFYFAFLQFYSGFLIIPAAVGLICWLFCSEYSILFAIANCVSCMIYVEMWRRRQDDLKIRWQTKGVSAIRMKRRAFKPERIIEDQLTHEQVPYFPVWRRVCRQLLQIPLALASIVSLGTLIAACFAIEILLSEVYDGPLKQYLSLVPTILVSALVPTLSGILTAFAKKLNDFENYETVDAYEAAMVHKHFVIDFITSYLPVLLTAFVYMPLGSVIVPYLDLLGGYTMQTFVSESEKIAPTPMKKFSINQRRLRDQVIYSAITAQVIDQITEIGVPFVKRKLLQKYKDYCDRRAEEKEWKEEGEQQQQGHGHEQTASPPSPQALRHVIADRPEEAAFLKRVREEVTLDKYDIAADFQEMVVQFGQMSLFSVVWPTVPLAFLCNNWVELRSDFVKICLECRRPVPMRAEGIGSWLDSLEFLAWLGSITSTAMLYMFRSRHRQGGEPAVTGDLTEDVTGWLLLLSIIFAEHTYLLLRWVVQKVVASVESPTRKALKASQYLLRKEHLDSMIDQRSDWEQPGGIHTLPTERVASQENLRIDTNLGVNGPRQATFGSIPPTPVAPGAGEGGADGGFSESAVFWAQQRGWKECVGAGETIIVEGPRMEAVTEESKKER
ncbi:hypothetical protein KEM52_003905 [Ascosphaera acerosa]|nr:hypothetical protein KEM52_003905 [Ascosphaera acerosa]